MKTITANTPFQKTKNAFFILVAAVSIFASCTKQNITQPAAVQSSSLQNATTATSLTSPAPGNYQVALYVNDGDTSTADFIGYVFTFKATGALIARVEKAVYQGKWESKDNGKELKLDIDGTELLHQIDKSWNVLKITNALINLNDSEHGISGKDVLVFTKIK